ncbi:hypothetical protein JJL45_09580 [Tamlana sp. s12]|uniref:hypothetical protein n=1 Tax=Tamlana sp. s12 TaxID=1630406 RepID=UPI0007FFA4C3|nr:hypothetical protein [Tamlana sp. s12]OBQ52800.1 hypothetical protein VQ01_12665 [Tamlana sp. s12]QQY81179.1 hypothetical protein JJL45_09580 [Tamlana sp. s12]
METKSQNISLKAILIIMAVGIWAVVLQNAGIIPTKQNVYLKGGYVNVSGNVGVSGSVDVDNTVDINISEVNGWGAKAYSNGLLGVYDPYQN